MAQNVTEAIFNSKNNLNDFYPQFPGVKTFDLQKKHLFYGRIDTAGDAVYLDDGNIKQIQGGITGTHLAADFVCEAFSDLRKNVRSAANKNYISKDSLYSGNLKVFKSWVDRDIEVSYNNYINKIYTTFVDSYLSRDRRTEKIKNYKDFCREFLRFLLRTAEYFPFTKTGFITSIHSSPFASGLMIEIGPESHGIHNNAKVLKYLNDVSFTFFVNEAKKFGFMIDKNAPWRMVFNLASGEQQRIQSSGEIISGGQMYMEKFAVNFNNVFPVYYRKAHLDELINLQGKFYSLYESFYLQFNTYSVETYTKCVKHQDSYDLNVKSQRKDREPPPLSNIGSKDQEEYWLKILFKLRLAETNTKYENENFNFLTNKIIQNHRTFGVVKALEEINNFTKGFKVTSFLNKGKYWYGVSEKQYQKRKFEIDQIANEPSLVDYPLTGTGNVG
tara:strand:- start:2597 stop:3928 length:1332 start_codon:yes stop_codon:yes gene_type:complete